jgi:hypothetical protein
MTKLEHCDNVVGTASPDQLCGPHTTNLVVATRAVARIGREPPSADPAGSPQTAAR